MAQSRDGHVVDPDEARTWSSTYYDIIKSEECVPLGHAVNANLAMVSAFSIHDDRAEAIPRAQRQIQRTHRAPATTQPTITAPV